MQFAAMFLAILLSDPIATVDPYSIRDGAAEAAADLKAGKPLSFYWQHISARSPQDSLPGIVRCEVSQFKISTPFHFLEIPKAEWRGGVTYSPEQDHRHSSALLFATAYNQTIYKARKSDILKTCPLAELAEEVRFRE